MIRGIGTDILSIARIQKLFYRHPETLAKRILHPRELKYMKDSLAGEDSKMRFIASRFCAKEAIYKATFPFQKLTWRDVCILPPESKEEGVNEPRTMKPEISINDKPVVDFIVSISHEREYVVAVALLQ